MGFGPMHCLLVAHAPCETVFVACMSMRCVLSPHELVLARGHMRLQAAHIGCGISGREGRAAVLVSDYAFAQFK